MRAAVAIGAAAVWLALPAASSAATTYTVTREDDPQPFLACTTNDCSLRAAVAAANAGSGGDTIVVPPGSYPLSGTQLSLTKDVTIAGAGPRATTIGTADPIRLFEVAAFATIRGVTLAGGNARFGGGLLVLSSGRVDLAESRVSANTARGQAMGDTMYGGGIYNQGGTANLSASTFDGNRANFSLAGHGYGGAIATTGAGTTTLTNVTVFDNLARPGSGNGLGGGVYTGPGATTTITNSTIAGNRAETPTPGFLPQGGNIASEGTTNVFNTIVADGQAGQGFANCGPGVTSLGHNLDSRNECGFTAAGDLVNADPALGALQNNGGPTDTRAIGAASRAFDAGTNNGCPGRDQRGFSRPQGAACDIGAFELAVSAPPSPPPGGTQGAPVISDLRVSPRRFRVGSRTTISFALSTAARVTFVFTRRAPGRRVRGRCVKPRERNARRPRCRRTVTAGRLAVAGVQGSNTVLFRGRLSGRKRLRPGRYRLRAVALDAAGRRSDPARAALRLLPRAVR